MSGPGHYETLRRPVPCRFVGLGRAGDDEWISLESLPTRLMVPVLVPNTGAVLAGDDEPLVLREPRFRAREFRFHRITAADHLGPTEAEYREVEG